LPAAFGTHVGDLSGDFLTEIVSKGHTDPVYTHRFESFGVGRFLSATFFKGSGG
jgi:hypothetical protein